VEHETRLESDTGERIALKSVHIEGRVDGLMLGTKIRQHYRNDSGKDLEVVYTFPLAWGATLLGLNVEIAGQRLQATVLEKAMAHEQYEQAIDQGDTPVMVEASSPGLYTANLGNLRDQDTLVVELEYAQLLRFEQGQLRVCLPTVIAPRYGDAHQGGGLATHETAAVDPLAEYPFTLCMDVLGPLARADIRCASHPVTTVVTEQGVSVRLTQGGMLDRDFVLLLGGLSTSSFAVSVPDGQAHVVLASFCPVLPQRPAEPLLMKVLVDCSGSMQGDSMRAAQAALQRIVPELQPQDFIAYSRFGSKVCHDLKRLSACTPATLEQVSRAISQTSADLGGTELSAALLSTFRDIPMPEAMLQTPGVLLITDGDVWDVDSVVRASVASGQRIFAIGVGSAPAESLLRDLADKTGGACELVSPQEDISAAIVRMFRRMRGAQTAQLRVDWGQTPLWQSPLPRQLYGEETVHLFARLAQAPHQPPRLTWETEGKDHHTRPEMLARQDAGKGEGSVLARFAAAVQMQGAATSEEALEIALRYQLISQQTNLFLVHVRSEEDKAGGLPVLHQVQQMHAAGHGGFGTASLSLIPTLCRKGAAPAAAGGSFDLCAFMESAPTSPMDLLRGFDEAAIRAANFSEALASTSPRTLPEDVEHLLSALEGVSAEQAWALFMTWLIERLAELYTPTRRAQRLLRSQVAGIDTAVCEALRQRWAAALPTLSPDDWGISMASA
jgi:Ca-activated chloride channel family protein